MISRLSVFITEVLQNSGVIEKKDNELYVYGFFVFLSQGMFFLLTVLFGLVIGTLWESVLFYILFSFLRCFAGGFHAKKESLCTFCTTVALFLAVLCISFLKQDGSNAIPLCMLVFGSLIVFFLSPLESEDKPLSGEEKRKYRKKSLEVVFAIVVIALGGWLIDIPGLCYASATSLTLEGGLLVFGRANSSDKHSTVKKSVF